MLLSNVNNIIYNDKINYNMQKRIQYVSWIYFSDNIMKNILHLINKCKKKTCFHAWKRSLAVVLVNKNKAGCEAGKAGRIY